MNKTKFLTYNAPPSGLKLHYFSSLLASYFNYKNLFEFVFDQVEDNPDDMAKTPLHIAAEKGHFEICEMILESKQVQNKTALDSHQSWCPLNFAVYNGQFEVAKLILEHIEDKNPGNQYGTTPLLLAAEFGKTRYLWVYKKHFYLFTLSFKRKNQL